MATILNLTQHNASADQVSEGVFEPADKKTVQQLLTFDTIPTATEIAERANALANLAKESGAKSAMIGGAPFLMAKLETALKAVCINPLYAFSVRESVDEVQADGSVIKRAVFRHAGWVEA